MRSDSPLNTTSAVGARRVLLTGASGVVGGAVLAELQDLPLTALTRRVEAVGRHPRLTTVTGDIAEPRLGLSWAAYERLVAEVDCVVNCAGLSHSGSTVDALEAANVTSTREVLAFCEAAGASLVHVSTAADERRVATTGPRSAFSVAPYVDSKRKGDRLVRASGLDAAIVKPSQVIGDSRSGATPRFQGVHKLGELLLEDEIGVLPMTPDARADFLPRDTVARAIAAVVRRPQVGGEWWLTAGPHALTVERVVEVLRDYAESIGRTPPPVRLIGSEVIDRLVRPALLPELPRRARVRLEYVIEFSKLIQPCDGDRSYTYPTSIPELLGGDVLSEVMLVDALRRSVDYWARQVGLASAALRVLS